MGHNYNRMKDKEWKRNFKAKKSEILNKIKLETGCTFCGYKKCVDALDMHHVDPKEKEGKVSQSSTWTSFYKEISKCVVLCSNCHRELHSGLHYGRVVRTKEYDKDQRKLF